MFLSLCLSTHLASEDSKAQIDYLRDSIWWSSFTVFIGNCTAFADSYIENYKSLISSSILIIYWLCYSIIGSCRLIGKILRNSDLATLYLNSATLINSIMILILEINVSPVVNIHYEGNLRDSANIFERITFSWMSPLMRKGYTKYLNLADLPPLPEELRAKKLCGILDENWQRELHNKKSPSLTWALTKSFGKPFFYGGTFELIKDFVRFGQPQVLKNLIRFAQKYVSGKTTSLVEGFMLVILMFGLSMIESICLHQYIEKIMDMGIKVRTSLNCLIYQKSLKLSVQARQKRSTGDIVNLMSVDTQRLQGLCNNIQIIWSGPLQVLLCLISLYKLMGNSMWIGIGILLLTVPLNVAISRALKSLQRIQMKVKDERTGLISEILNNIKSLKLYAWEEPYRKKLMDVRNGKELKNLQHIGIYQAMNQFVFNVAPSIVSTSTFAVFMVIYSGNALSTDIAFTAISLFNLLQFPLSVFPWAISDFIEAKVSVTRLSSFLESEELDPYSVIRLDAETKSSVPAVEVHKGNFLWSKYPSKKALQQIEFEAFNGTLSCFVGRVGAGKSAFAQALLGNLYKESGEVIMRGSVAYVPQVSWIMNGTVKENILFGFKEDPEFYAKTIKACALTQDLEVFPNGDMTQVGEKGISLSGGQKARLSLARAVYARANIYIFDDILSAVDEHVGKHLINHVLGPDGLLSSRCRILCTNNLHVLKFADQICLLEHGSIMEHGTYKGLVKSNSKTRLSQLLEEFGTKQDRQQAPTSTRDPEKPSSMVETSSESSIESINTLEVAELEDYEREARKVDRTKVKSGRSEKHQQGKVKWSVYKAYMQACGSRNVLIFMLFIIISMAFSVLANVWLKHWSDRNNTVNSDTSQWGSLGIYFLLCFAGAVFTFCQSLIQWLLCSISGSKIMHQNMLDSILRAPMEFFETTPIGRILNRFSNDIFKIDEMLFRVFATLFGSFANVAFTLLVIVVSTWQFIFFIIPLAFIYHYYQRYYLATSRELRRLDSITRSPIFAHFQETLNGVQTIRAYDQISRFNFLSYYKMGVNMGAYHPSMTANRWLGMRLEYLGSLIILGASGLLIASLGSSYVTPGLVGLSVSYALQITQSLDRMVRMSAKIESDIVSVERVNEYSTLTSEAPTIIPTNRPAETWPAKGEISFHHYSTRYRKELDLVLKDISLEVKPKEKIGIVGRTGAGKSSLTLALFRIIEPTGGYISIDDLNTSEIGLYDLRSKLSIIPQDAQIFQGTIRANIDPTDQYQDDDIWRALKLSHLEDHVNEMYTEYHDKDKIDYNPLNLELAEGGSNLSAGQRQLMCLTRALCKRSCKILVLDEATANVDVETDSIVQNTIRTAFKDRTILTIAHRLNTVIDSDRILVLEDGKVAEYDAPKKLLENDKSLFYSLCKEGGLVSK